MAMLHLNLYNNWCVIKESHCITSILTHLAYRVNGKINLIYQTIIHSFESTSKTRAS